MHAALFGPHANPKDEEALYRAFRKIDRDRNGTCTIRCRVARLVADPFCFLSPDRPGYLDPEELRMFMMTLEIPDFNVRDIDGLIRDADENGDGRISFNEFVRLLKAKGEASLLSHPPNPRQLQDAFRRLDANGDGVLSRGELKMFAREFVQTEGLSKQYVEKLLREADRNGDGRIDVHEFLATFDQPFMQDLKGSVGKDALPFRILQVIHQTTNGLPACQCHLGFDLFRSFHNKPHPFHEPFNRGAL